MQNFVDGNVPIGDNKVVSLRNYAFSALQPKYEVEELSNIVEWLLEHFTGLNKHQHNDSAIMVNQSDIIHFCNAVEKLVAGLPVQYVIGEVGFYGLKLKVNPSVLIPRPETEELVDMIVKENKTSSSLRILDIGTGSGCIALSLAAKLKGSKVTAIDVSTSALATARENADLNQLDNVEFLEMDLLKENGLKEMEFDLIVSNPPYIATSESSTISPHVLDHEPTEALFVPDNDPLRFYKTIADLLHSHLASKGKLYLEINEKLGPETLNVFSSPSFSSLHLLKDMFGKNRFIKAEKL